MAPDNYHFWLANIIPMATDSLSSNLDCCSDIRFADFFSLNSATDTFLVMNWATHKVVIRGKSNQLNKQLKKTRLEAITLKEQEYKAP